MNCFYLKQAEAPKKKVKKINVPVVEVVYGAMSVADVQKAVEKEFEMALQDRVMEETKDKKNAVEAYVYDMRNKVRVVMIFLLFYVEYLIVTRLISCYHFSLMTNTKSLSLIQRGKHSLLNFRRWKTGYMKMVKMRLKVYTLPN